MQAKPILIVVAALPAAALACSVDLGLPRLETGPTETVAISEPLPSGVEVIELEINMGAGRLDLAGGGAGALEGEIRYNVPEWAPEITNTGDRLTVSQSNTDGIQLLPEDDEVENDWTLRLGDIAYDLTLNAGAYEGTVDLSGVPVRRLVVHDGASQARVKFDAANPEPMTELRYETGASSVSLSGLANANAERVTFSGGAGDYELDFSGELQRDLVVDITSGVSDVTVRVPAGATVVVNVAGGLNDVDLDGDWSQSGDTYTLSGSGPTITIDVDMGVGSLNLVVD